MNYKTIFVIAVLLITQSMLRSTYCEAKTLEEIKKDACPNGKVQMNKIITDESKFRWMKPNETVLVFPEQEGFPAAKLKELMEPEAIDYARDSLRLIPPITKTKKFLKLYEDAILTVKGSASTVTTPMVVEAFKTFKDCCLPLNIGKTEVPENYPDLHSLITDTSKHEAPLANDLLPPQP